ncbi:MAG: ABC transporter-related protein [Parcubacteria group bacterium GW2011_GWA2_49_16]|uniref:ABC transporter-related protein n=2 Tax=Parcubacteria group TaxID=1794811 RepID=A0A0G1Z270_9BACT|nr:MAG: ABC transporter-related protein [Parcubacteria group bacterium GW2011_GWA2_49_16]KKW21452.1 MAG: ABC transporter-related protein [Candidatus Adlerbacteria bacterium GW2011_GWC1_50_9]KKW30170.1 MAG: ABC transporter-related protein [Candidatus Kaiserbacteria bacterium GW2011_GWC2_52_8b]
MSTIIEVKHITKLYSLNRSSEHYLAFRDALTSALRSPLRFLTRKVRIMAGSEKQNFLALKDISLTVSKGEIIGIIGPNGAGKSTFLKILNRITEPTSGEVIVHGKIASLLEVGTGFHPELTGRENIFFSGAILGMKRKEIIEKFDAIVKFAEIGDFLDTPVKRYSSGMHVRLAFSVAAHMEPDILLIDEVLAVGDAAFQKKCIEKIYDVAKRDKRTIFFVSHNLDAVQSLCDRTVYLERGELKMIGETNTVIQKYLDRQGGIQGAAVRELPDLPNKKFQMRKLVLKNESGTPETDFEAGKTFYLDVEYEVARDNSVFWITLQCINEYGTIVFTSRDTDKNPILLPGRKSGRYSTTFKFPGSSSISLNSGKYFLTVKIDQDPTSEVTLPIRIADIFKKFHPFPGAVLIGEPWVNKEKNHPFAEAKRW